MGRAKYTRERQGRKLTFLGRLQLATDLFFSVTKWENVATSCEILVASAKFLVALATRKAQFPTLERKYARACFSLAPPAREETGAHFP